MSESHTIVLSLISHTNIGKTTLTRTLLRRDVGEVRDAAHVTEISERFVMVENGDDQLILWDTPGFGNVSSLLKRLHQEGGALGWLMHEVVDRAFNRPLYSSLEAARNVRAEADVVLYLVNAREHPADAGYVGLELQLLESLGKPVLMIINQTDAHAADLDQGKLERSWKGHYGRFSCLRGVVLLDAFTRSWMQELHLMDELQELLPQNKRQALARLRHRFLMNWEHIFHTCTSAASKTLRFAMEQRLENNGQAESKKLFSRLVNQLQSHLDEYLELLVKSHGIESEGRARLEADIEKVTGLVQQPLSEERSGLLAGAVSSASAGLMADMVSGGLTLGGGALLGFLGGYLGGFSYAKVLNLFRKGGRVAWQKDALLHLYKLLLSYYLLAALHGRGKGRLDVERPIPILAKTIEIHWNDLSAGVDMLLDDPGDPQDWEPRFERVFQDGVLTVLTEIYGDVVGIDPFEGDDAGP